MTSTTVVWRIMKFFYRKMPIASILSNLAYILENFHPTIITILSAYFFEAAYDYLADSSNVTALWGYAMFMIGYYIIYRFMSWLSSICINASIYEKALHLLNDDLIEAISGLQLVQYENDEILACRKRAEECVKNDRIPGIYMLMIVLMTSVAGIFSLLVTLCLYHPLLPVVAVVSVVQFFLSDWLIEKEGYRMETSLTQKKRKRDYIWFLFTDFASVKEMRVMGFTGYLAGRWKEERDEVNEEQWKLDRKRCRYHLICDAIKTFGYLTGVILCMLLLRKSIISVGVFGACLVAFSSVQTAVGNFFSSVGKIPGFVGLAADFFTFTDRSVRQEKKKEKKLQVFQGSKGTIETTEAVETIGTIEVIEIENVSFRYPHNEELTVKSASLTIHRGEVVSLVGVNGSGKTTLVKLILGIYSPEQGGVYYNGMNLESLNKESLYQHTALLSQDFTIYPLSLDENIALADISHVEEKERIWEALKRVHMEDMFDKEVDYKGDDYINDCKGENENKNEDKNDNKRILGKEFGGLEFSGGQKQRLALARVLFADRELIILDEPTSALDPLQENEILEEFLRLAAGRTTIIISHRVGLCRHVDKIAVMQEGKIIECGTHDKLMADGGEYAKLYDVQSKWYLDPAIP